MDSLTFIQATVAHAPVLAALFEEAFAGSDSNGWDEEDFAKLLGNPGAFATLALFEEAPVGFASGQDAGDEAEIVTLGVIPSARRRNVGRALVEEIARRALELGASRLFLEVAVDNPAAISLYENTGFSRVGQRKGYYSRRNTGAKVDALVMRRDIV